ncbi:hypothetical protein Poly30_10000 [Planctomycetes bacterium Poly30]|uniref:Sulfotransferase family protein n=1 Tax=Saltatorellus ferox TaxID=2528018 RepID=A0A518EN41_9BACT|nr:hypothetical protein Poly30_10000 [Planctomycetes bacterium Poly30]
MPSRPFVITGAPRSELSFTSRVFTALGAPCGDEGVFHTAAFERGGTLFWPTSLAGDSSWYAAPVLGKLPEGSVVIHQVRHPLATIHDLYASRFFERDSPSRDFVNDFLPETRRGGSLDRCMRLWVEWHRMIEVAGDYEDLIYRRYRLEDFNEHRACEQLALLGLQRDAGNARRVIEELGGVPTRQQVPLAWEDLPVTRLTREVMAAAAEYGYDVPGAEFDSDSARSA